MFMNLWCFYWIGLVLMCASGEKPETFAPYFFVGATLLAVLHLLCWFIQQVYLYW